jgi:aerobic carbon-monoxide dehydrogenase medium subunit
MYPASFDYSAPVSLDETLTLLHEHDNAKLLAGGHSLLPLLKLRFAEPSHLVDLRRVPGLVGVRRELNTLIIGAMTTHAELASSTLIGSTLPILADAAVVIGDPQVRNRGTIGGSLAHADPSADLPAVILATDAQIVAAGRNGIRTIPSDHFFVDMLTSALAMGEILTEVRFTIPGSNTGGAYSKQPHPASRYAVVGIAASVELDAKRQTIRSARIGVTGLGFKATLATATAEALVGKLPDRLTIHDAAALIADGIEPREDLQGDAAYKTHLARVHAERAIAKAVARARS